MRPPMASPEYVRKLPPKVEGGGSYSAVGSLSLYDVKFPPKAEGGGSFSAVGSLSLYDARLPLRVEGGVRPPPWVR